MSRYVVIGAGAIGATVAAQLHLAGVPVVVVARGEHLAALQADGLTYVTPSGTRVLRLPAVGEPPALTADDVLVLATKSQDTEALLQQWSWLPVGSPASTAAASLPVLLLQNGMDTARSALRRFATVLDAVVVMPSTHLSPGVVVAPGDPVPGAVYLGCYPGGTSAVASAVGADLAAAGLAVRVVDDVTRWKAGKLLMNVGGNVDALYPPSALRAELAGALREEARAVLAAAGIEPVPAGGAGPVQVGSADVPGHPRGGSSTWQSLARSGSVESDYLNGEVVLLARLHGMAAPLNAGVQERLGRAGFTGAAPGSLGEDDLRALLGR